MFKSILTTGVTLAILAWALPTVGFSSFVTLIIASIVLTILYSLVRPVLKILFLPVNVVTLGLFSGIINIFLLWLSTYLVPGFHIQNMIIYGTKFNQFWSLIFVSFLIGFIHSLLKKLL
ncbi:phage holin family protein [Patescibacteria group bacterium]|nr:phage holin family protein [Patescibacteria group bacterium]